MALQLTSYRLFRHRIIKDIIINHEYSFHGWDMKESIVFLTL